MHEKENADAIVRATARPESDQDDPRQWSWVEATVWTDRMLAALGNGVRGGKWHSLKKAGLVTSNKHIEPHSVMLTVLCGGGCGRSCVSGRSVRVLVARLAIIGVGRIPSSLSTGFSPYRKPMLRRANPERETTDWRAVCGRTACTVRRAGRMRVFPDPYQIHLVHLSISILPRKYFGSPCLFVNTHQNF